jgi:hypothetical protein
MHKQRDKITQRRQHQARRTRNADPTTDHHDDTQHFEGENPCEGGAISTRSYRS